MSKIGDIAFDAIFFGGIGYTFGYLSRALIIAVRERWFDLGLPESRKAIIERERLIDARGAELIRRGMDPVDAAVKARDELKREADETTKLLKREGIE